MRNFDRIWIRGDTHGDFSFLPSFCEQQQATANDLLIILGDVGLNYYGCTSNKEQRVKRSIQQLGITLLCIRGNHEDRPEDRPEYTLTDVGIGDKVYTDKMYPNIWFAQDGGEYYINNYSFLTIGGAYSVDKFHRVLMGYKWVANEELNSDERAVILDKVYHKEYDYVLTHTCPIEWEPVDLFIPSIDQSKVSKKMEYFLSDVKRYVEYGIWFFGHYHNTREWKQERAVMLYENTYLLSDFDKLKG